MKAINKVYLAYIISAVLVMLVTLFCIGFSNFCYDKGFEEGFRLGQAVSHQLYK